MKQTLGCAFFATFLALPGLAGASLTIDNVRAAQRAGTKLVDVHYDLSDAPNPVVVTLRVSNDGGSTFNVLVNSVSGDVGGGVSEGLNRRIVWNAGLDWDNQFSSAMCFEVSAEDTPSDQTGDYVVIDLAGGPDAADYPVSFLTEIPLGGWTDEYKTTKLVLRRIPGGSYTMGSTALELGRDVDETGHPVILLNDYCMGVFEVTQRQWQLVMGNKPAWFSNADYYYTRPIESVSYHQIRENPANSDAPAVNWPANSSVHASSFVGKLRSKTGLTEIDLPTEAQWEYACRAGMATAINNGSYLSNEMSDPAMDTVARYSPNSGALSGDFFTFSTTTQGTAAAGSYAANRWGLYDMHGNVWEWCLDWFTAYDGEALYDPTGGDMASCRVARGGCWSSPAKHCRSSNRNGALPNSKGNGLGFRLASGVPGSIRSTEISGALNFGDVYLGDLKTNSITIVNNGTTVLYINGLQLPNAYSSRWSGILTPGQQVEVPITFEPSDLAGFAGNLKVLSAGVTTGGNYYLYGRGVQPAEYMVIDLSGGASQNATISYLAEVPAGGWTAEYKTNKMVLRLIPSGVFMMGSPESELGHNGNWAVDEVLHEVTLTKDFYIGVFEVTQRQYELIMGTRPSYFRNPQYYATRPVEQVSWWNLREGPNNVDDPASDWPTNRNVNASSFFGRLRWMTSNEQIDLPTEAQWEYACRAGTETALNNGKNLGTRFPLDDPHPSLADVALEEVARYIWNTELTPLDMKGNEEAEFLDWSSGTNQVGSYAPNYWGLYDMHGNVCEWTLDYFSTSSDLPVTDPVGGTKDLSRRFRGGGWSRSVAECRSAARQNWGQGDRDWGIGLRVARHLPFAATSRIISLSGALDYGTVLVGQSATRNVTISNGGMQAVHVTGLSLPDGFTGNWLGTLAGGSSVEVSLTFTAHWTGRYDGELIVRSDALQGNHTMTMNALCVDSLTPTDEYMVIDLSSGPSSNDYPVSYLSRMPDGGWTDEYKTTKLVMRRVAAGQFLMGSPEDEVGAMWNEPLPMSVTLTKDFYVGVFEVTQRQWELVMGDNPSSYVGPTRPVDAALYGVIRGMESGLNWPSNITVDANSFIGKLRAKSHRGEIDLPTEAQWEYTCRAGTSTALNNGLNLVEAEDEDPGLNLLGRYESNVPFGQDPTAMVGSYLPNAWGLYDMHGNVQEWCLDSYYDDLGDLYSGMETDPVGPSYSFIADKVLRGGSWHSRPERCRSAARRSLAPSGPLFQSDLGFRLYRTLP